MTPQNQESPAPQTEAKFFIVPAVGPLRPKRRSKSQAAAPVDAPRVIIPIALEPPRETRLKKSGHAFQVWKSPKRHFRSPLQVRRRGKFPSFLDLARFYARATALISSTRLGHSH